MITEEPSSSAVTLENLGQSWERLRADLDVIQRELDQALSSWRSFLANEKKEFKGFVEAKQKIWDGQETEWQAQRAGYERKIQDLEEFFTSQLTASEQNAVKALNELDDSWQRDKILWQQSLGQRVKESHERETLWAAECQRQEHTIQELRDRILQLQLQVLEGASPAPSSSASVEDSVAALESHVNTLSDFVQQASGGNRGQH